MKISRKTLLHDTFRVAIVLKGLDGLMELVGGSLVWLLSPEAMIHLVRRLFGHQLAGDPRYFAAHYLILATESLARQKWFATAFLLTHGTAKVVLVAALWLNQLWAYPVMIAVVGGFTIYQAERVVATHSALLALLTLFDVLVVLLTWREYREQKRIRARAGKSV